MQYPKQKRERVVALAREIGVNAAAKRSRVSQSTVCNWMKKTPAPRRRKANGESKPMLSVPIEFKPERARGLRALVVSDASPHELIDLLKGMGWE